MHPYQQRIVDEASELRAKIDKLDAFMTHDDVFKGLDDEAQELLERQIACMVGYWNVLQARIDRF